MHEAGASVVAAQLLSFCKEPVRYRPKLTHGRRPFAGGLLAFRFALGRFPNALLRDLPPAERERVRAAAEFFVRQVCLWEGATHYQVLCVPTDARREAIKEHYHALMALIHPDRNEARGSAWPADAAQRANAAYAVLSDDERRREYDASLTKASGPARLDDVPHEPPLTAAVHAPVTGRMAAARVRYRRPALVVSAVIAAIFFFHAWIAGEVPQQYSALQSAIPFELSTRWMHDAFRSGERPRYLRAGHSPSPGAQDSRVEAEPLLMPLWRAIAPALAPAPPVRKPEPVAPAPAAAPAAATAAIAAPAAGAAPAAVAVAAPPPRPAAPPPPRAGAAQRIAQAPPAPPSQPEVAAAQASRAPAKAPAEISTEAMEMLVAMLVTFYEAGDLERFLALQDAQSIGVWEATRLRQDFQEFFRETKSRRLRLNNVALEIEGRRARARGEATLSAEYADSSGRIERSVRIELDAVAREGTPLISRLVLHPHDG